MKGTLMETGKFSPLALELLATSDEKLSRLEEGSRLDLIEMAPVVLPEAAVGDNDHVGWPVATQVDGALVVIHRRIPGHNPWGAGNGDENSTFSMARTSLDGGRTWSESFDLREAMHPNDKNRGGDLPVSHRYKFGPVNESNQGYKLHLNAIGTSSAKSVVVLCNYGAFRSTDQGRSWTHLNEQFREDTTEGDIVYLGPRIVDHPEMGLCAFGNTVGYERTGRHPNLVPGPSELHQHNLVVLRSEDDGVTWEKTIHELPNWAVQHEPAAVAHEGDVFIMGRDERARTSYQQIRLSGGRPIDVRRTANIRHTRIMDTLDLDFNPVTGRFEVVRSFREKLLVDLWSIDPSEWESAEWRFEGVLFAKRSTGEGEDFYKTADGFHPAGAVMAEEKGVQHIFVYTGHPNGPAGSFRITRTLETPRLAEFLGIKHED